MQLAALKAEMQRLGNPEKAEFFKRFFKTGPGEYAEGDQFVGITVPEQRRLARRYCRELSLTEIVQLLQSQIHEYRLTALLMLVLQFKRADEAVRKQIVELYLANTSQVNNWDLVDSSAPQLLGEYLLDKERGLLDDLAASKLLWERRIAILASFAFIKREQFADTLRIAEHLLADQHDLIHKAVGWMLREVGNHDQMTEEKFLQKHYRVMPRTMLRYAIEKFPEKRRQAYLKGTA